MKNPFADFKWYDKYLLLPIFFPWLMVYRYCEKHQSKEWVKAIPNVISWVRIAVTPISCYFLWVIYWGLTPLNSFLWIYSFGLMAYGDRIDGKVARDFKAESQLGIMLDPASDKIVFLSHMAEVSYLLLLTYSWQISKAIPVLFSILIFCEIVLVIEAFVGLRMKKAGYTVTRNSNRYGKIKFTLETIAVLYCYAVINLEKLCCHLNASYVSNILIALLSACILFASLSIYYHNKERLSAYIP